MPLTAAYVSPEAAIVQSFLVNTAADGSDGLCDETHCTLREAILAANTNAGTDTIVFNIIGTAPHTLVLTSALPAISQPVIIDATTNPDFAGTPLIELNGTGLGTADGFTITGGGSTIRGFVINRFGGNGIKITNTGNNIIEGNYIGTDATGSMALPNNNHGVYIVTNSNNRIGGTAPGSRNLISGNLGSGIVIEQSSNGNLVQGNYIGVDVTGTIDLGNHGSGVWVENAASNIIGGTSVSARNIISGNKLVGIRIRANTSDGASSNRIQGNYIGTNTAGTATITNAAEAIWIDKANSNTIGGTTGTTPGSSCTGACNLIGGTGIRLASSINTVHGNYIGLDSSGTGVLEGMVTGIWIGGGSNTIGGTSASARNLIAGYSNYGIQINGGGSNVVQGNYIGTDKTGTADLTQTGTGIGIWGSKSNRIGGTTAVIPGNSCTGSCNLISGNMNGITLDYGSSQNFIGGNYIGTNVAGDAIIKNSIGIVIKDSSNNYIGIYEGTAATSGNLISGSLVGVEIYSYSMQNSIQGNYIGTAADGLTPLGNQKGINIWYSSPNNIIGGSVSKYANIISGNTADGIVLANSLSTSILDNIIGLDRNGSTFVGNGGHGINISSNANNSILTGNQIAANAGAGIFIQGSTGNQLLGNRIFENNGLGIDLYPAGLTTNDLKDADIGANNLQNFPVLTEALVSPTTGKVTVTGTLNSTPNATFRLDFYGVDACDLSGYGEGDFLLSILSPEWGDPDGLPPSGGITDSNGNTSFTYTLAGKMARAITATATSANNNTSEYSACIPLLNPPVSLELKAVSPNSINLSWVDYSDAETAYRIERSLDGSNWTEIGIVTANATSFTDTDVLCGVPYTYRARAYNATSAQFSAYTVPTTTRTVCNLLAPTNLQATATSVTQVQLSWVDRATNESFYLLERSEDGGATWNELEQAAIDSQSYVDTNVVCEKTYAYRVQAAHFNGQVSDAANVATVVMPLCAPTNLMAAASASEVTLGWEDNSLSETAYKIERRFNPTDTWTEIASVGADVESYADSSLTCNQQSQYRVRAYRSVDGVYSPYSVSTSVLTPLCEPADLSLTQMVNNPTPGEGEPVTFTITVTNDGPNPATGVGVRNVVPKGLMAQASTASQGTYVTGSWTVGTVDVGGSATLELTFQVMDSVYSQTLNHLVEISRSDAQDPDSTPNNNLDEEDDQNTVGVLISCAPVSVLNVGAGDIAGLITAIQAANNETCFPGPDTITLAANSAYILTQSYVFDLYGFSGLPAITSTVTIEGNGATLERSSANGTPSFRILYVSGSMTQPGVGGNLTLNHVTVKNGLANTTTGNSNYRGSYGGGLFNWFGTVQITNTTFVDNNSNAYGGGIYNQGTLTLNSSLLTRNKTASLAYGAAIANYGAFTVTNSTFSANQGMYTVYSSTTSSNLLAHNTFVANNATAAVYRPSGTLILQANLLVDTTNQNCGGYGITSNGYNISDDASCTAFFAQPTDLQDTNLRLGLLADNGGSTLSYAPFSGSSAIDRIPAGECTLTNDQRNISRPDDADGDGTAKCDVGAVEVGRADVVITKAVSAPTRNIHDPVTYTVQLTNNGPDDALGVVVFDLLPAAVTYTSANGSQGSYDATSGLWTIGRVNVGSSVTLQLNGLVNSAAGSSVLNTALLASASVNDPEGAPQATAEFSVSCPTEAVFNVAAGDVQGLMNAIDAANRETCFPGLNTITLATGSTYTLMAAHPASAGADGLPTISSEIVIEGREATILRDASAPPFRLLNISSSGKLTLNQLTLLNGQSTTGAGLFNQGIVAINRSTLSANTASERGGAICNTGTLTITESELSGNQAYTGGALANLGSFTLTSSDLISNGVSGGTSQGGGIANLGGTGLIENSILSNNQATVSGAFGGGGAIWNGGFLPINTTVFTNNTASGMYANGGAIYTSTRNLMVTNSTFTGNAAPAGGAIYHNGGSLAITGSTFAANQAASQGGGVRSTANTTITVSNSTFFGNQAGSGGGLALTSTSADVSYSTFYGNTAEDGGAIAGQSATTLTANLFANNISGSCDEVEMISGGYNIADDDTCGFHAVGDKNNTPPLLDILADNGGPTQTHALLAGSPALGTIPPAVCTVTVDQRGISRPQGDGCEPGAFEGTGGTPPSGFPPTVLTVSTVEDTGDGTLTQDEITDAAITQFVITFSTAVQNPDGDTASVDVTNPMSYRLVTVGADGIFQTGGCGTASGDDGLITIDSAVYAADTHTVTLALNAGTPLPFDTYRLLVCASAIQSRDSLRLDGNDDGAAGDHFFRGFSTDARHYTADLVATQIDHPDPVLVGSTLTYSLTVSNNGPQRAFDVVLTDVLPPGVSFVSASHPACTTAGGAVTCNLGTLLKAASQTVDITVSVGATTIGTLTNTVSVTSSTTDPNTADNTNITETTQANEPPATSLLVNAVDDNTDGVCGIIHCNLRDALLAANSRPGLDTIAFNLPGQPPYPIKLRAALPEITEAVVLDGWSQPGFAGTPIIELDGTSAGDYTNGLVISSGGSTVRGLVINRFKRHGLLIKTGGGNTIQGNYIGTNVSGTAAFPNVQEGIYLDNAPNNLIGGTTDQARNLISGNTESGISISGANSVGTIIRGNYIGTDVTGMVALGNQYGIAFSSSNITIGGTEGTTPGGDCTGACNLISGNKESAILGRNQLNNLTIQGNYIGTTVTGEAALGNKTAIELESVGSGILIGGTTPAARNVISGNGLGTSWIVFYLSSTQITVQGNYIGTDVDGEAFILPRPHLRTGGNALIGGTADGAGNLIAGTLEVSANSLVQGNLIGTDATGTILLGGSIYVNGPNTQVGGASAEARNIITNGISVGATNATIQGNYIGVDITGSNPLGNPSSGIYVSTSQNVTIGGTNPGEGNVIANSQHDGIYIYYSRYSTPSSVNIVGNSIFNNVELGIDLQKENEVGDPGQTPNDNGDTDTGANLLQNYPILSYTANNDTASILEGSLSSSANATFRIDLYANRVCDHSGYGEGERYLGSTTVTTNSAGLGAFSLTVSPAAPANQFITATATDATGHTSEFSACRQLNAPSLVAAPSGLTVNAAVANNLDLTWVDNAPDETAYHVERSLNGVSDWQEIATTAANVTTYRDAGLVCDTIYYYRVRAFQSGSSSFSNFSAFASAKTLPCVLVVPTLQTVTVLSATQMRLNWLDASTNETAYRIERSLNGETDWQEVGSVNADKTSFEDSGLICETTYHYRVRAFRSSDNQYTDYSAVLAATTAPCAPADLLVTASSLSQAQLTWLDHSMTETAYLVERSPDGVGSWAVIANLAADTITYADNDVCNVLYYRVRAFRATDTLYSTYSNVATITLSGCEPQPGPTFTVTTLLDSSDGSCDQLHCSLREAITAANTYAGNSIIQIPTGEILLNTRLNINANTSLMGAGADKTVLRVNRPANYHMQAIEIAAGRIVSISGVSILDAFGEGAIINRTNSVLTVSDSTIRNTLHGSGIYNQGTLTVIRSLIAENQVEYQGGGIRSTGPLTIIDSTIRDNSTEYSSWTGDDTILGGGGIFKMGAGDLTIINSTLSNNDADKNGGGVFFYQTASEVGGILTITNSTLSGNKAYTGSGIWFSDATDSAYLNHVTLTKGYAYDAEAIFVQTGSHSIEVTGSIIAGNQGSQYTHGSVMGAVSLIGSNLIDIEPDLGLLQDNGGPTFTHALLPHSPALDALPAEQCSLTTDQRGVSRPFDSNQDGTADCDLGAVEMNVLPPVADLQLNQTVSTDIPSAGSSILYTLTLTNNGPDGAAHIVVRETFPTGLTFEQAEPSQGSYTSNLWTVGDLAAGASATLKLFVKVDVTTINYSLTTISEIITSDSRDLDSTPNNSVTSEDDYIATTVTVQLPDVCTGNTVQVANRDAAGLVQAITAANNSGGCTIIELAAGGYYELTAVSDNSYGTSGLPAITRRLTIQGNGATIERSTAPGTPDFRIFYIYGGNLTLNDVIVRNGHLEQIPYSSSNNYYGGGLLNRNGNVLVNRSTFTGNWAVYGGAIASESMGTITLLNSTISGNSAMYGGGGVSNVGYYNHSQIAITNSTIANNSASRSGGLLQNSYGSAVLRSSILANNQSDNCWPQGSAISTRGYNLSDDDSCSRYLNDPTDQNNIPALIDILQPNGSALTHTLLAGSPAIDVIPAASCHEDVTDDQTGIVRPQGVACDIGAVEVLATKPPAPPTGLLATALSPTIIELTWTANGDDGNEFHLERSTNGSNGWTEIGLITTNSYRDSGLTCGATYHYRVRTFRASDNQFSDFSPSAHATTKLCPPEMDAPVLMTPANGSVIINLQPEFRWSAVTGAALYELELNYGNGLKATFRSTSTVYQPASSLLTTTYTWQVRAVDMDKNVSAWSVPFTVTLSSANNAAPERNLYISDTPTLRWGAVSWAVGYEIQIARDAGFNQLEETRLVEGGILEITTKSLADGVYYWRVRAINKDEVHGGWSAVERFQIANADD
ncbi:MAG TPA: choice-of-anchor Q domain-containing protein [Phototrophicaceae bacterium]|nr:choice-of-anchor Q domain-containing protein [Phototrophicaceae bacterium]